MAYQPAGTDIAIQTEKVEGCAAVTKSNFVRRLDTLIKAIYETPEGGCGCCLEKWIEWVEPFGPKDQAVYLRMPISTAVATQRFVGRSIPNRPYEYESDAAALEDFMITHWAHYTEPPSLVGLNLQSESKASQTKPVSQEYGFMSVETGIWTHQELVELLAFRKAEYAGNTNPIVKAWLDELEQEVMLKEDKPSPSVLLNNDENTASSIDWLSE